MLAHKNLILIFVILFLVIILVLLKKKNTIENFQNYIFVDKIYGVRHPNKSQSPSVSENCDKEKNETTLILNGKNIGLAYSWSYLIVKKFS